jgi:hypothetical protein
MRREALRPWLPRRRLPERCLSEGDGVAREFGETTPQERDPEGAIKVSKASMATRVSPKP